MLNIVLLDKSPISITAEYKTAKIKVNQSIELRNERFQNPVLAEIKIQIAPNKKVNEIKTIRFAAKK